MPTVIGSTSIAANVTAVDVGKTVDGIGANKSVTLVAEFVYGGGGAANGVTAWIQTTLDGNNWYDIACFEFSQATQTLSLACKFDEGVSAAQTLATAQLAANTALQGVHGNALKMVLTTTGAAYTGNTSIKISMQER